MKLKLNIAKLTSSMLLSKLLFLVTLLAFVSLSFSAQSSNIGTFDDNSNIRIAEIQEPVDDTDAPNPTGTSLTAFTGSYKLAHPLKAVNVTPLYKPTTPTLTFLTHTKPRSPPLLA